MMGCFRRGRDEGMRGWGEGEMGGWGEKNINNL
jgi:hypothetical protein